MNRDHVKLEAAGVEAIHRVFRAWMPEVTIDVHEKGDGYYKVNIGCVSNANISPAPPGLFAADAPGRGRSRAQEEEVTFHEYLVTEEMGSTGAAGVETLGRAGRRPRGRIHALQHDRPQRRPEQPRDLRNAVLHPGRGVPSRPGNARGEDRLAVFRAPVLHGSRGRARRRRFVKIVRDLQGKLRDRGKAARPRTTSSSPHGLCPRPEEPDARPAGV